MSKEKNFSAAFLDVFLNLGVLLVQALAALVWHGELRAVRSVVAGEHVDGGVKSGEGLLASNVIEAAVERHEVNHFLLHVLVDRIHIGRSLFHLHEQ